MTQDTFIAYLLLSFGSLIFFAAVFNWNYFFGLRKAQLLIKYVGLTATRIIYGAFGLFFALVGSNKIWDLEWFPF